MDFRIIGGNNGRNAKSDFEFEKEYLIPGHATHIYVRAMKICFGIVRNDNRNFIRTGRGRTYKIPWLIDDKLVKYVKFIQTENDYYGTPIYY